MNESVDIQAGIVLISALLGLLAYAFRLTCAISPKKLRGTLQQCKLTTSSPVFTLKELNESDQKGVLVLYYWRSVLLSFLLVILLPMSFGTVSVCALRLLMAAEGNLIPRAVFVQSVILFLVSSFVQGVMMVFIEKTKSNIEECSAEA